MGAKTEIAWSRLSAEAPHDGMRKLAAICEKRGITARGLARTMGVSDHNSVLAFFSRSNPTAQTFERIVTALGYPKLVANALRGESLKDLESFSDAFESTNLLYFASAEVGSYAPISLYPTMDGVEKPLYIGSGRDLFKLGWLQARITTPTTLPNRADLARALDTAVLADAGISGARASIQTSANNSRFLSAFNSVIECFGLYIVDGRWWDQSEAFEEAMRAAEILANAIGAGSGSLARHQIISFVREAFSA